MFTIRLCKHNLMQKSTLLQQTRLQPTLPYRKIPKISPGADIFEGPFSGAYLWKEICVSKSIGLAL